MASDQTEPRTEVIIRLAIVSVLTVVGMRYGLVSYFNTKYDEEYAVKIAGKRNGELEELRKEYEQKVVGGALPIEKAMQLVATSPRASLSEAIAPKPSDDLAPVVGWGLDPKPLPEPPVAPAPSADATDAGATATDGAAHPSPAASNPTPGHGPVPAPSGAPGPARPAGSPTHKP